MTATSKRLLLGRAVVSFPRFIGLWQEHRIKLWHEAEGEYKWCETCKHIHWCGNHQLPETMDTKEELGKRYVAF